MNIVTQEIEVGGRKIILERGRLAGQASSAVTARYGDTMVLVTVVAAPLKQELDYFPLFVEYVERLYAGGRIKGSRWVKREGRPSDDAILSARLIDRSIRPLFPKDYKKEVQVIVTVLSVDLENDPAVLSVVATSAALATSNIPWDGPVGSLRVGEKDGTYFANPVSSELEFSDLDLILTAGQDNILMIEAGARQVPEEKILGALEFGQKEAQKIIVGIEEFAKKVGVEKEKVAKVADAEIVSLVDKKFGKEIDAFAKSNASKEGGTDSLGIKQAIIEELGSEKAGLVGATFEKVLRQRVRATILTGKRLDGRKHDEIRSISGMVGVLPRTHGSAIFQRGDTQVLTVATLGSRNLGQLIESAEGEEEKRYIHHYSMPPYSLGETGRIGSPSRREIGHGALAERALLPVIPLGEKFPYTIQVVSEVLSSNGSTSMASTCGSTMSLMDAGVPIEKPVAGIAMGLIIEGAKVVILSDIMGIEDGSGDMDFKVAGTEDGVTAIQLDVKTPSLTLDILKIALEQAKEGRLFILNKIIEVIAKPRPKISEYAPKIVMVKIPTEKIGEIIGPGGKIIRNIMAETGATVDVEDDGMVSIAGTTEESVNRAKEWVEGLVKEVQPGEIYTGEVKRIQPFGAFVEILPGKDGLVHVSDMAEEFVKDPNDIVKIGDKVQVRVKEIDELKRINLSMLLDGDKKREPRREGTPSFTRERSFAPRTSGGRGFRGGAEGERRGGPHFPASRFMPKKRF
ncbi:MAG: polyribonucleotide nucleotidyltransferase [bacterium]|nr:polyribonucleotide nucleotidyltransferase [bacterium]